MNRTDQHPVGVQAISENRVMLNALQAVQEIVKDLRPGCDRVDYLKEAREGALYGCPAEQPTCGC